MARRRKHGSRFTHRRRQARLRPVITRAERLAARNLQKERRAAGRVMGHVKSLITDSRGVENNKIQNIIKRLCKDCFRRNQLFYELRRLTPEERVVALSLMSWKAQDSIYEVLTTKWRCPKEPLEAREALLKKYVPALLEMYRG